MKSTHAYDYRLQSGSTGTVKTIGVLPLGQVSVCWDSGHTFPDLIPGTDLFEVIEPLPHFEGISAAPMRTCSACKGTGRDHMSDNTNWLSCMQCGGSGLR
jgi:hypothetical protein